MDINQEEKEKFLASFSEDDFRDRVVRRLFIALGYKDGRDLCGPEEEGKDAIFLEKDKFGDAQVTAVQTKVGSITLAGDPSKNLHGLLVQVRTALAQPHVCVRTKRKIPATFVYVVASGRINRAARNFVVDSVEDPRVKFLDRDDLIAKIDESCPEIWFGIIAEVSPYLSALAAKVDDLSFNIDANPVHSSIGAYIAASDNKFVDITLGRPVLKLRRLNGKVFEDYDYEEVVGTEILSGRDRILLSGDAGSGKSTLLVRLAYLLAKKSIVSSTSYVVPLLMRAYDLASEDTSDLLGTLAAVVSRMFGLKKPPFDVDDLEFGRVVLLVDGLDELADTADRQRVIDFLNNFSARYPLCSLVLSTRPYASIGGLNGISSFKRYGVNPLGLDAADRMLKRSSSPSADSKSDADWRSEILRRLDSVHGIELNPLLVTVFAVSSGAEKRDIPANITELFSKFTELMLGRWDEKKGFSQQYQSKVKDRVISDFAFIMQRDGRKSFSRSEFVEFSKDYLTAVGLTADLDIVVNEVLDRSGLFRGDLAEIEFKHHLLQEYFASRGIPSVDFIKENIADEWWQNSAVFYFGSKPENVSDLMGVVTDPSIVAKDAFVPVGLALQACYLSRMEDRLEVWRWVVEGGAAAAMEQLGKSPEFPVTEFLQGYLFARDAVAMGGVESASEDLIQWIVEGNSPAATPELRRFWYAVALGELGRFDMLEDFLKEHPFENGVLATAIHYGGYFAASVRAISEDAKARALKVCKMLDRQVEPFRIKIAEEFKGQLLEYRRGGVIALDQEEPAHD